MTRNSEPATPAPGPGPGLTPTLLRCAARSQSTEQDHGERSPRVWTAWLRAVARAESCAPRRGARAGWVLGYTAESISMPWALTIWAPAPPRTRMAAACRRAALEGRSVRGWRPRGDKDVPANRRARSSPGTVPCAPRRGRMGVDVHQSPPPCLPAGTRGAHASAAGFSTGGWAVSFGRAAHSASVWCGSLVW